MLTIGVKKMKLSDVVELLKLAHRYELYPLCKGYADVICNSLTADNVLTVSDDNDDVICLLSKFFCWLQICRVALALNSSTGGIAPSYFSSYAQLCLCQRCLKFALDNLTSVLSLQKHDDLVGVLSGLLMCLQKFDTKRVS